MGTMRFAGAMAGILLTAGFMVHAGEGNDKSQVVRVTSYKLRATAHGWTLRVTGYLPQDKSRLSTVYSEGAYRIGSSSAIASHTLTTTDYDIPVNVQGVSGHEYVRVRDAGGTWRVSKDLIETDCPSGKYSGANLPKWIRESSDLLLAWEPCLGAKVAVRTSSGWEGNFIKQHGSSTTTSGLLLTGKNDSADCKYVSKPLATSVNDGEQFRIVLGIEAKEQMPPVTAPARILTFSSDVPNGRFSICQFGKVLQVFATDRSEPAIDQQLCEFQMHDYGKHKIDLKYDHGSWTCCLDGKQQVDYTLELKPWSPDWTLRLGDEVGNVPRNWDGTITRLEFYSKLPPTQ